MIQLLDDRIAQLSLWPGPLDEFVLRRAELHVQVVRRLGQPQARLLLQRRADHRARRQRGAHVQRVLNPIRLGRWRFQGQIHLGAAFAQLRGQLLLTAKWVRLLPVNLYGVFRLLHVDVREACLLKVCVEDADVRLLLDLYLEGPARLDCGERVLEKVGHGLLAFLGRTVDLVQLVEHHLAEDLVE